MLGTFKSEFRKLLSIRSTYVIWAIMLAAEVFIFWWVKGFRESGGNAAQTVMPTLYTNDIFIVASVLMIIPVIASILLVTHEYRYNTIMYTLTASKSRTRVLIAKFVVITIFACVTMTVFGALAPTLERLGMAMGHHTLAPQHIVYSSVVWRALFAGWAACMYAAIISFLVRNQVGAIMITFLFPTTVENLLTLWLQKNSIYLPFNVVGQLTLTDSSSRISFTHAALVSLAYIVGGGIVAWVLFVKRDAN